MEAPGLILPIGGTPSSFRVKSLGYFKRHREARAAEAAALRKRGDLIVLICGVVSVPAALGYFLGGSEQAGLALIAAIIVMVWGFMQKSTAASIEAMPEVAPEVQTLLKALLPDLHPKCKLNGTIDLRRPQSHGQVERTATSPFSQATKNYYRERWFRLAGQLVDGSPIAVEATTLAKTKGGSCIRSTLQVRGRITPRHGSLSGEHDFSPLRAVGFEQNGQPQIAFWGVIGDMDDIIPALRALGLALHSGSAVSRP